jgi:ketosteroid isomerase-like protein
LTEGIDIITAMFADWNAHDLEAVYAHLTEDYREYLNGALAKASRAEARAADEALYEAVPDYTRTVEELWGLRDRVVSRFVIKGTMADGHSFEVAIAGIFGIRDGRLCEAHLFFDPATAVRPA